MTPVFGPLTGAKEEGNGVGVLTAKPKYSFGERRRQQREGLPCPAGVKASLGVCVALEVQREIQRLCNLSALQELVARRRRRL